MLGVLIILNPSHPENKYSLQDVFLGQNGSTFMHSTLVPHQYPNPRITGRKKITKTLPLNQGHLRIVAKCLTLSADLEAVLASITYVYSNGAVEGYTKEWLGTGYFS